MIVEVSFWIVALSVHYLRYAFTLQKRKKMLFKPELIRWSLEESPHTGETKTETRRMWKCPHEKVGGIYKAKTLMLSKEFHFWYRNLGMRQERLGDVTDEDARREGFLNRHHFLKRFVEINRKKLKNIPAYEIDDLEPTIIRYEVVDRCPGCELYSKYYSGCEYKLSMAHREIYEDLKGLIHIGVRSCSEFKLKKGLLA